MIYLINGKDVYDNSIDIHILNEKIYKIIKYEDNNKDTAIAYDTNKKSEKKEDLENNINKNIQKYEKDDTIINLNGKLVMPGIIDIHTHMREPGITHKEDFATGSRACAKGGITTFYDMPNTIPTTTTLEELEKKKKLAQKKSIVNYGFHFGGSKNNNIDEIQKVLNNKSANTVKIFMNITTGEMLIEDDKLLEQVFKNSKLVLVHAENEMIDKAIRLNKDFGSGVYICHIPSEEELTKVINAKKDNKLNNGNHPIYAEITPHHLFLNDRHRDFGYNISDNKFTNNDINKMLLRMKPELRGKKDNEFLWQAINSGYVDTIGTDHAPHLLTEKLEKITFGMPGVETSLSLMLTAASNNKITYSKIQELMCENPAKIMKIKNRGQLKEGYYADIIIVDKDFEFVVKKEELESKCGWSPYENWQLKGKNMMTIVNGKISYVDNIFSKNIIQIDTILENSVFENNTSNKTIKNDILIDNNIVENNKSNDTPLNTSIKNEKEDKNINNLIIKNIIGTNDIKLNNRIKTNIEIDNFKTIGKEVEFYE